ncbi:MAG TPA: ABC transporter substrate-binding protein [Dehalococcoidia bacterium]|nr:ABC transporter substrate-binding protein [Dehalococcoidia bacterium]
MARDYWARVLDRRLTRRRALAAAGAGIAGAGLIAACGGDGEGGEDVARLVGKPVDETKSAKRGGVYKARNTFEPSTLDPHLFPNNFHVAATYSNLWQIKDGVLEYSDGTIEGDLVESWETSPDKLTITAKISPKAHFAPLPPVNGRAVDAQDVAATWQRHSSISNQRGDFSNAANPAAPILSIAALDDRTISIKLAAPNAVVTARLARFTPGSMYIVPKEALDPSVLNLARTSIGSGPYYISDFQPSVGITFKRNPGFGQDPRGFPFIDQLEYPTIQEYAQFLSQFRAGNIYEAIGLQAQDVVPTKRDLPELELLPTYYGTVLPRVGFGVAPGSPFLDERLRQAWVLTWDRDLFLDAVFNADKFRQDGLDVDIVYESGLQANTFAGWLLDPQGKDFGPNSRFFKKDLAEAKKLLAAAGYPNGVEDFELIYAAPQAAVPAAYSALIEPVIGLTQDSGLFRWRLNIVQNYFAEFFPKYHNQSLAPFSGVAISLSNLNEDPANYLFSYYNSRGSLRMGTDSTLDDLTSKAVAEFDDKRRMDLVHEIQRYEGGKNFYPRFGGGTGFSLGWPAVRNRQVYQGGTRGGTPNNPSTLWLDPERPPLKRT